MSKVSEAATGETPKVEAAKSEAQGEAPAAEKAEVQIPKGYIEDSQERLVPIRRVRAADLERDRLVRELVADAEQIHERLAAFRTQATARIDDFVEKAGKEYDAPMTGDKGNVTLSSYDGRLRVQISVTEYMEFDERLQVARKLIEGCVKRWGRNASTKLRALINDALQVDKKGHLNAKRLLALRKHEMDGDAEWGRAMQAISDSVRVARTKRYVRVQRRTADGRYETVSLSLATV